MAPEVGLEPTTLRLTAECSAIELLRIAWRTQATGRLLLNLYSKCARVGQSGVILFINPRRCHAAHQPSQSLRDEPRAPRHLRPPPEALSHSSLKITEDILAAQPNAGIIDIPSNPSVDQTVDALTRILAAKGVALFALIDHSGEAQ